jgi:hypothetical protein
MTTGPEPKPESTWETKSEAPSLEFQDTAERPESALDRLRGLMREEFAEYGGGEAFLKWLRTDPGDDGPREWGTTMEIRCTLTIKDYSAGNSLMLRNSGFGRRLGYWQATWLGPLMGVWLFCVGFVLIYPKLADPWMAAVVFVVGLVAFSAPLRYRRLLRKRFAMQKLDTELLVTASSAGIEVKRESRDAETRYGWSAIEKQMETEELFVLFPNMVQFLPIPKRVMTPEQQQEFRGLIAASMAIGVSR